MENKKGRGAKLVLLVTLLSMLMVVTLATSWPWWWDFTHHMLTNLMLTPAGKRQGWQYSSQDIPCLQRDADLSIHTTSSSKAAPDLLGLHVPFLQPSAQEAWTWDSLLPFLTTFERVQGRQLPWWGWNGYDVTHTSLGCSSGSQLGRVCICRWCSSSALRCRSCFQTR